MSKGINEKFIKAYEMAGKTSIQFPPDILLHFYAYYKRATERNGFYIPPTHEGDLRSAFKINALIQVKKLSKKEAKSRYIKLVEEHIGEIPQ